MDDVRYDDDIVGYFIEDLTVGALGQLSPAGDRG